MKFLTQAKISTRLPLMITMAFVLTLTAISVQQLFSLRANAVERGQEQARFLALSQKIAIEEWFERVADDVEALSNSPTIKTALSDLAGVIPTLSEAQSETIRSAYVEDSPHPVGARQRLDNAGQVESYDTIHADIHPYLRRVQDLQGYYDIFLFLPDGLMAYSVAKETDFWVNFKTGPLSSSGLGDLVGRTSGATDIIFEDFLPYAPSNGDPAAFIGSTVRNSAGDLLGYLAVQLPIDQIAQTLSSVPDLPDSAEIYLLGEDGKLRSPTRNHADFATLSAGPETAVEMAAFDGQPHSGTRAGLGGETVLSFSAPIKVFKSNWSIVTEFNRAELIAATFTDSLTIIGIGIVGAVLSLLLGIAIARSITKPLGAFAESMDRVAADDLSTEIAGLDRHDEIGTLAQNLDRFRTHIAEAQSLRDAQETFQQKQKDVVTRLGTALQNVANGDLDAQISENLGADYEELRQNFNQTVEAIRDVIVSVVDQSQELRSRSEEITASSFDLSRRTENQAATLEETAAALDELTASVKTAAQNASEVESSVSTTRRGAESSETVVRDAVDAMSLIQKSSDEISQIIGVIDDISFQTNLLALNAGVEAARAGEAGRGFAVVASEVRALAQRSSEAAKQIKTLIENSKDQVDTGVALVGKAGEALSSILVQIGQIDGLMRDIATGAKEQSAGLEEINVGVTQLDQVTQQNAAMVEEATETAQKLSQDAEKLGQSISAFDSSAGITSVAPPAFQEEFSETPPTAAPDIAVFEEEPGEPVTATPAPVIQQDDMSSKSAAMWQDF